MLGKEKKSANLGNKGDLPCPSLALQDTLIVAKYVRNNRTV